MRIGEAARRVGVSERCLRYYEQQGLVRPARGEGGQRDYREEDIRRLQHVRTLLAAGLTTEVIAEVLPCMRTDGEIVAPACADLVGELLAERRRITEQIEGLRQARAVLDRVIAAAPAPEASAA